MAPPPKLTTERLQLRALRLEDAATISRLAGDRAIAATTLNIPHPYDEAMAREFLEKQRQEGEAHLAFAIERQSEEGLIGMGGLMVDRNNDSAEMGYWIGRPFWNNGYATEAATAILAYGFDTLGLHRIGAQTFAENEASGKVLRRVGLLYEGRKRHGVKKWGEYVDLDQFGLLATDR